MQENAYEIHMSVFGSKLTSVNIRNTWLLFPAHGSKVVVKVLQSQRPGVLKQRGVKFQIAKDRNSRGGNN